MGYKAVLTKVKNKKRVRAKLPNWTDRDPDKIISDVESGRRRIITTRNCEACKEDLEKHDASVVVVEPR